MAGRRSGEMRTEGSLESCPPRVDRELCAMKKANPGDMEKVVWKGQGIWEQKKATPAGAAFLGASTIKFYLRLFVNRDEVLAIRRHGLPSRIAPPTKLNGEVAVQLSPGGSGNLAHCNDPLIFLRFFHVIFRLLC
jgi:hypothetical protein